MDEIYMDEMYSRIEMLVGRDGLERLKQSRVAVFGAGGVGGYVIEALVRCGVGVLDIFDNDRVAVSNLNRQILASRSTIGMLKTEAAARRALSINPDTVINRHDCFFMPENSRQFDFSRFSYVVDAIDTVTGKIEIIVRASEAGVPVISCMGTGNKLHPELLEVSDIYETSVCPLARVMRRELRVRGIPSLRVVYSKEKPITPFVPDEPETRASVPGSAVFVPAAAGMIIAAEVVRGLLPLP